MRITILVDNNAGQNLMGEWGFSAFIEVDNQSILFDLGASDLFLQNAGALTIDALNPDFLVLSHGHYDHTWGLNVFLDRRQRLGAIEKKPVLVAHPLALVPKYRKNKTEFGVTIAPTALEYNFQTHLSRTPFWLTEQIVFLGEIERRFSFENTRPLGQTYDRDGQLVDDLLWDDSALAIKTPRGLVIISGCAHSGLCNTIEHARRICQDERVVDVIGGFHLKEPYYDESQLAKTIEYLRGLRLEGVYPCHCTELKAKVALAQVGKLGEVSTGLTLEY